MSPSPISPGLRFLLSAACLVIVVAGLRGATTILVPLALALFVAVVSLPLLNLLRARGVPTAAAILMVVLFDGAALFLFGWMVSLASLEVRYELPQYVERLQQMEEATVAWFTARGVPIDASPIGELLSMDPESILGIGLGVIRGATDIIRTVFVVTLIFVFILAEASSFPRKLRALLGREWGGELGRSAKIVREIQHYLAIKTLISVATGVTIGVVTWGLGLDFPLLWGLLAFLLNYIPNVGSIIAALPAILVALLQLGPGVALLVALVYIGVNALFGNFLEPMLVGRQLGISTLVVVLSLVFWGWVWGPIGMFLSVPLTMALKIGLENSEDFRWLAFLMAAEPKPRPRGDIASPVPPPSTTGTRSPKRVS
ncbi:MAG: AI-2E family transporter [Gemmatimonadota bacterium]